TPRSERTQALYQRFGISGRHPPEPLDPSKRKLYIRDLIYHGDTLLTPLSERTQALYRRFGISEGHPPEPPSPSEHKLYIRDLACQGDTPLNPPVRANASFISEM